MGIRWSLGQAECRIVPSYVLYACKVAFEASIDLDCKKSKLIHLVFGMLNKLVFFYISRNYDISLIDIFNILLLHHYTSESGDFQIQINKRN